MDKQLKKALDVADLMSVINQQKRICKDNIDASQEG